MIERIDHVAILVRDIQASLPHYMEELGLSLVHDECIDARIRLVYLRSGSDERSTMVQLIQPLQPGPLQQVLNERGEGLHHLCFAVNDIRETLQNLTGEAAARIFTGGRGRRCAYLLKQYNEVLVELTELAPPEIEVSNRDP